MLWTTLWFYTMCHDEVTTLLKQLDDGLSVDSITRVSWTSGDMALSTWRMKGTGLSELVGKVLRDQDTEARMYWE